MNFTFYRKISSSPKLHLESVSPLSNQKPKIVPTPPEVADKKIVHNNVPKHEHRAKVPSAAVPNSSRNVPKQSNVPQDVPKFVPHRVVENIPSQESVEQVIIS